LDIDENRRTAHLIFPGDVPAEIGMSRHEKYSKPGSKPQVTAAFIQDDLRRRDFTINAIALSLNRGSRGLLIDPTNGLADLTTKEMRATHSYAFYEDPARLLRLIRFRVRFTFTVEERTQRQYENAREAELEKLILGRTLFEELRDIAEEPNAGEIMRELGARGAAQDFLDGAGGAEAERALDRQAGKAAAAAAGGERHSSRRHGAVPVRAGGKTVG